MSAGRIRRIILIICLVLAALSLALALLYTPPAQASTPKQSDDAAPYTIKAYQGYVAVFTPQSTTPSRVTNIRTELLPLQDQLDLASGIPVYTKEALSALLEDFGS